MKCAVQQPSGPLLRALATQLGSQGSLNEWIIAFHWIGQGFEIRRIHALCGMRLESGHFGCNPCLGHLLYKLYMNRPVSAFDRVSWTRWLIVSGICAKIREASR